MFSSVTATENHLCKCGIDNTVLTDRLQAEDMGYYILWRLGTGTGATVEQLTDLTVEDVRHRNYLSLPVGPLCIRRTYNLPEKLQEEIFEYTKGRSGRLFILSDGRQMYPKMAREVFSRMGIPTDFLSAVLRRYYEETQDIRYPMHMLQLTPHETLTSLYG